MEEPLLIDVPLIQNIDKDKTSDISDNEEMVFCKPKRKVFNMSDSDSDTPPITSTQIENNNSDSEPGESSLVKTSRIKIKPMSDDSDSDNNSQTISPTDTIMKSARIKDRDEKLGNKFKKSFMKKKIQENEELIPNNTDALNQNTKIGDLYDPESSDEEQPQITNNEYDSNDEKQTPIESNSENVPKTKAPQRMSSKQAMEQMQKIKSESSRMLREKRFHLPYHRPKQISLKDIMNKKKIEFTPGVKKLTLRMNEEQLLEYAKQLEEKEKEMIQLYKNESDEENNSNVDNTETTEATTDSINIPVQNLESISNEIPSNDKLHDDVCVNNEVAHTDHTINNIVPMETNDDIDSSLTNLLKETIDFVNNYEKNKDDNQMKNENESDSINYPSTSKCGSVESQPIARRIISDDIMCSLPVKPKLSGTPGSFIDLTPEIKEELTGVDILKKKYLFHSSLKTPEELEFEHVQKILPGTTFMNLRRELEEKISQKRIEECNKKKAEDLLKIKENDEADGELSECEELLEKESDTEINSCKDNDNDNDESDDSNESEPEIDDEEVEMKTKQKTKCDYIEDEAELDDEDDASSDESDDDDVIDDKSKPMGNKKKLTRIYKAFSESSGDEGDSICQNKNDLSKKKSNESSIDIMSTPMKMTDKDSDIFDSQDINKPNNESFSMDSDDYLPPGQKFIPKTPLTCPNTSYSSFDNTPTEFKGRTQQSSTSIDNMVFQNILTPRKRSISPDKWNNLHKNLFNDQDSLDIGTQDIDEIAGLCSGKFPTQSSSPLFSTNNFDTEMSQNTEMEIMELCTGKFSGINTQNTEPIQSESMNESQSSSTDLIKEDVNVSNVTENSNITSKCQTNVILPVKKKMPNIKSFFLPKAMDTIIEKSVVSDTAIDKCEEIPNLEIPVSPPKGKFVIMSSSDEDDENKTNTKNKVLLSKRARNKKLKVKPLEISDDESDNDDDSNASYDGVSDADSNVSTKNNEKDVEYDSEENEIEENNIENTEVVKSVPKKKQTSEFFDHEAEMTSEDEWKGSGDEDERGLDELESEEGDADNLDQRKVTKELERIHRHQMLDQDKREIKILQDILLEDDLEGGTRERKFKWKNVDDEVESGAVVGDDNVEENIDEVQSEEQWRRQRHERETFLRELMEKENLKNSETPERTSNINVRMSIIKGTLNSNLKLNKWNNVSPKLHKNNDDIANKNKLVSNTETESIITKKNKDLPSPVKTPLQLIQPGFKGSFLTRGQAAMNRLASLTKNGGGSKDDETNKNLNSRRGNFVFTTVSPPCNKVTVDEDTKKTKRKAALPSTPLLIKKVKLSEENTKFKKSLFDHIE